MIWALSDFVDRFFNYHQRTIQSEAHCIYKNFLSRLESTTERILTSQPLSHNVDRKLVVNATACELAEMLNSKTITSVELLILFIREAVEIGRKYYLIVDEMFDEALVEAIESDRVRQQTGKVNWTFDQKR
jgi:hypothetical protein